MKYRTMLSRRILESILAVWISFSIYAVADTDTDIEGPVDASASSGQMPNPVGASRVFPKTSFSCKSRPAGYYADVETGCQVYHMCDGVGRQFSYACPNTTLFQQRMLICDHWYMVNCSRAENDYAANLLIGQKDKPFVPENEHQQRTPRPDLLDRPYAPDYSGESFRNNYKDLPPIQNHISDSYNSKDLGKPLPTRWSLKNSLKAKGNSVYSNRRSDSATDDGDLGTSFSLRYNSTGDISSELITESHVHKTTDSNTIIESNQSQTATATVKVPSKIYQPPFLHPIYNNDYTENLTTTSTSTTTITAFATSLSTTEATTTTTLTTPQSIPTETVTFTGRPFEVTNSIAPNAAETPASRKGANNVHDYSKLVQRINPITERHGSTTTNFIKSSTFENHIDSHFRGSSISFEPKAKDKSPFGLPAESVKNNVPTPPRDLLPPFQEYVVHDVATTQGPPIYYEWKTPTDSLEPPKLSVETGNSADSPNLSLEPSAPAFSHNPFLSTLSRTKNSPSSVDKDALLDSLNVSKSSGKIGGALKRLVADYPTDQQIEDIQRELLIPNFLFPLESDGRTGYELDEPLDSFQLKIPRKRNVRTLRRQRRHS